MLPNRQFNHLIIGFSHLIFGYLDWTTEIPKQLTVYPIQPLSQSWKDPDLHEENWKQRTQVFSERNSNIFFICY